MLFYSTVHEQSAGYYKNASAVLKLEKEKLVGVKTFLAIEPKTKGNRKLIAETLPKSLMGFCRTPINISNIDQFVCLFVWVLWHINFCRLFDAKLIFIQINSSISNNSV